ncbi:MAG: toxin TcdB middle/N-terminal domain-containing protein, partial [Candidatus Desantisbacteria bacterium]
GDFNSDARTDVGIYNNTNGELKVALSSGSSFSVSGTWLSFPSASISWQPFTGNFNADKYTDFALYNKDTGEVKVALGTGSGFGALNTWINSFGNDYIALSGDFNGDSLTDLCLFKKSSGEFKIAFSNSKEFVDGTSWISGFATDKDAFVSDFNNDGLADIGYWDKSGCRWYYAISTGTRFIDKGLWLDNFGTAQDESGTTGDFNADGITDAACFDRDQIGINRWTTRISTDKPTDLLVEVDNGIGGKTQVTYTHASMFDNDLLPFPVYVASSIALVDTLPTNQPQETYIQDFTYYGGYYDAAEREFRGFAKVRVTDPITNNYSETYFYQGKSGQDGALKGQIEKIIAYDGNSREISKTINTYEVRKAGPEDRFLGFPALTEQVMTVWEGNAYLTTKDKFIYDNIGNLLEGINEGDISKTGDEKSAVTTYAQAYTTGF